MWKNHTRQRHLSHIFHVTVIQVSIAHPRLTPTKQQNLGPSVLDALRGPMPSGGIDEANRFGSNEQEWDVRAGESRLGENGTDSDISQLLWRRGNYSWQH